MKSKPRNKRVHLILNGKVAGNDALRAAVARQRAAGHRIEVRVTWEMGDARRFASEAGERDLVVAAGGDGTLNEVLHGLMDLSEAARPILGIVPLGTANDFATGCGIPRDPAKALALCIRGDGGYQSTSARLMSTGLSMQPALASVLRSQQPHHRNSKRLLGPAAYTVMVQFWRSIFIIIRKASFARPRITGSGPVAIVGNGRQTGGGIQVAPHARIDDGLLDVLVVRQISPTALLAAARELQQLPPDGAYISYSQTPWLEVHAEEAIPVNLDGEPLSFSTVRYEAVPKAIQLIVPPNCQLLSRPKLKA